jgi:hypothetical protein
MFRNRYSSPEELIASGKGANFGLHGEYRELRRFVDEIKRAREATGLTLRIGTVPGTLSGSWNLIRIFQQAEAPLSSLRRETPCTVGVAKCLSVAQSLRGTRHRHRQQRRVLPPRYWPRASELAWFPPAPPNDTAHLPGRLQEVGVARNRCCGPGQVERLVRRWGLCHDHGSTSTVMSGKLANWLSLVRNTSQPNSIAAARWRASASP